MNLNQNLRMEYVEISDCKVMFDFMNRIVDEIYEKIPQEESFSRGRSTEEKILKFDAGPKQESMFSEDEMNMFKNM